jgi:hypothetical protein
MQNPVAMENLWGKLEILSLLADILRRAACGYCFAFLNF